MQEQASDVQELNENINKNTAAISKTFDKLDNISSGKDPFKSLSNIKSKYILKINIYSYFLRNYP